jgi:hypothetical protein
MTSFSFILGVAPLVVACELDDQDRVLGSQADEDNKADLCQDVDRHAPGQQAGDRCEQARA